MDGNDTRFFCVAPCVYICLLQKWASYVETFVSSSSLAEDSRLAAQVKERLTNRPIFLMR